MKIGTPEIAGAGRARLAAACVALIALSLTSASADESTTQSIQSDAYLMARLRAGQSWDSGALSIGEMRPGTVDQTQFEAYVATAAEPGALHSNLELVAALGPQILTDDGDVLTLQTASASWGEPGILPRSHLGSDGVWEFPRLPDQDEQDMLVGQRWRLVQNV